MTCFVFPMVRSDVFCSIKYFAHHMYTYKKSKQNEKAKRLQKLNKLAFFFSNLQLYKQEYLMIQIKTFLLTLQLSFKFTHLEFSALHFCSKIIAEIFSENKMYADKMQGFFPKQCSSINYSNKYLHILQRKFSSKLQLRFQQLNTFFRYTSQTMRRC